MSPAETVQTHTDVALVTLAKAGDEAAYMELYRRHSPMATRAIRRITRNREDTEDVLQDTFIRAMVHLDSFDGRAQFSTWVTRIAVNSALMLLRKQRRRRELSIDAAYDETNWSSVQIEDPKPGPESIYAETEQVYRMRDAVNRLPPLLRNVTVLRCSQGMPVKEVAIAAGISVSAAKSRLMRASEELRNIMHVPPAAQRLSVRQH